MKKTFTGMKPIQAIVEHLQGNGGTASVSDLADHLRVGGCRLGTANPQANVRRCVRAMESRKLVRYDGQRDLVSLIAESECSGKIGHEPSVETLLR